MTFHKIGQKIILDPITQEEEASDGRLSIGFSHNKGKILINALQKGEEAAFDKKEIFNIIDLAEKKFKENSAKLLKMMDSK